MLVYPLASPHLQYGHEKSSLANVNCQAFSADATLLTLLALAFWNAVDGAAAANSKTRLPRTFIGEHRGGLYFMSTMIEG